MIREEDSNLNQLSGWILPEGRWYPTKEWWHISGLYDLIDEGHLLLTSSEAIPIFKEGDEDSIRNYVSQLGFIKISRLQLDGEQINKQQLVTLKKLLLLSDPDQELEILSAKVGLVKKISIARIFKLKNANSLFDKIII